VDTAETFSHVHAGGPEASGHHSRDVLVLGRQDPGAGLEQHDPGAKFGEYRRDLGARADDQEGIRGASSSSDRNMAYLPTSLTTSCARSSNRS